MTATRTATATVDVNLGYRGPLDRGALLRAIAAHAIAGLESCDVVTGRHRKVLPTPHGDAVVELDLGAREGVITAQLHLGDPDDEDEVVATVRRWLDLDADTDAIHAAFAGDPRLGPLVAHRPGLRVLGSTDPFETAVLTVVGQQVSLAAARTFGSRLVATFGSPVRDGLVAFPRAEVLAEADPQVLRSAVGLTSARAATVCRLAEIVASGLTLDHHAWHSDVEAELMAVPGIGRWTVDYLALRVSGDGDAFAPGDLVLRRALGARTAREAAAIAEAWRPWRAYALMHLWTHAAYDEAPEIKGCEDPRDG